MSNTAHPVAPGGVQPNDRVKKERPLPTTPEERIAYLEDMVIQLYQIVSYDYMGMDQDMRLRLVGKVDEKVRALGIWPAIEEKR